MAPIPDNAQTNGTGQVAIKHRQPNPAHIKIGGELKYITTPRANISLAWIEPQDLPQVLNMRGGCCGRKAPLFHLANESDVRRWTNGGGR